MSKSDTYENSVLDILFRAVALANIWDNAAASPNTDIHVSLHTADPGDAGTQITSEAAYTSYARQAVARPAGWAAASGGSTSPAANIDFTEATGGGETETHFICGKLLTTAGVSFYHGTVTPNIVVSSGVTPRLTTASTITEA